MKDCDPVVEQAKADRLEALYQASGRHTKGHPLYGRYTGLCQEFVAQQAAQEQEVA